MKPLYEIPRCTCGGKAHLTDGDADGMWRYAVVQCDVCGRRVEIASGTKATARAAALAKWRNEVGA